MPKSIQHSSPSTSLSAKRSVAELIARAEREASGAEAEAHNNLINDGRFQHAVALAKAESDLTYGLTASDTALRPTVRRCRVTRKVSSDDSGAKESQLSWLEKEELRTARASKEGTQQDVPPTPSTSTNGPS